MSELAARIQTVINRCRVPDRAGEAVLAELKKTYVLVPIDVASFRDRLILELWDGAPSDLTPERKEKLWRAMSGWIDCVLLALRSDNTARDAPSGG